MNSLNELNNSDDDQALKIISPLIERAPKIAHKVAAQRPFHSLDHLGSIIHSELLKLSDADKIELFRSHPELAPDNPLTMTIESQSEQKRLALTSEENEHRAQLDELNKQYLEKFDFPFITALVRHPNIDSVLAEFKDRLNRDRSSELREAIEQISEVSLSRIQSNFEINNKLIWQGTIGGVLLFVLSLIFMYGGLELGLGSPLRLGTGAFPFTTGLILAILAVVICYNELHGKGLTDTPDWVAFLAICSALAVFAVSADRLGLIPAAFFTVVIASLPDRNLRLTGKLKLGGIVALVSWALFVEALNLPFKAVVGF